MSSFTIDVTMAGDKELFRAMQLLPSKIGKNALISSIRHALRPALKMSQRMIPVESGALHDSMTISTKRFARARGFTGVGKVWPKMFFTRQWKGKTRRPFNYAHLVERGHVIVRGGKRDRGGKEITIIPGQPFIRDAFEATKQIQATRFRSKFLQLSMKEWRKLIPFAPRKRKVA